MNVDSITKFRIDNRKRYKEGYLSPEMGLHETCSASYLKNNYRDIERPLKTLNSNLSFKGLSFIPKLYKPLDKIYSKKEFLRFTDKYLGKMGEELLDNITVAHKNRTSKLIEVRKINPKGGEEAENMEIVIKKKTIPHLAFDGILYPFKILPGDILNGLVQFLGKIPGLKNWSAQTLEKDFFKNIRQRSKIDAKINSLVGLVTYRDEKIAQKLKNYAKTIGKNVEDLTQKEKDILIEQVEKELGSSTFQSGMKMFDPKTGNYDTKHERALNRLVSGLPPAIFLANDAYNLSRMMDDDSKAAEKERKIRFKQETSRILTSGYLTLITMGAFQKFINKSKLGIVLLTGTTVLITEMFSRLSNGKHIIRLTPEKAREENKKLKAPEAEIKPDNTPKKEPVHSTGNNKNQKEQQKPLLSFDTLLKASAVVLSLGYGIKLTKNASSVKRAALKYFENMKTANPDKYKNLEIEKAFQKAKNQYKKANPLTRLDGTAIERKNPLLTDNEIELENAVKIFEDKVIYRPFTEFYKHITSTAYHVEREKFDKTVKILRENGFKEFADKYEEIGKSSIPEGKDYLDLGSADRTFKVFGQKISVKPFVNFVIAPFKFIWNTVTLPYWMIDEKIGNLFRKTMPKSAPKDIEALAKSFEKISKKAEDLADKKLSEKEFKDYIQDNLLKAFNYDSMSSVSNAELSNLAKTAASIATIWFLMTDNYNMVMLKSNGNDINGANTKFKERFVQEGSRLFYQTLLIDLFNSTFRNSYNGSLLGMSWVTLTDTTLGEMLTRSSVGIPIKAHTRDELIEIETKQNNSTGFIKKYYNFMQRLTGKRSIKSYEVSSTGTAEVSEPENNTVTMNKNIMFNSNSILDQMIRG